MANAVTEPWERQHGDNVTPRGQWGRCAGLNGALYGPGGAKNAAPMSRGAEEGEDPALLLTLRPVPAAARPADVRGVCPQTRLGRWGWGWKREPGPDFTPPNTWCLRGGAGIRGYVYRDEFGITFMSTNTRCVYRNELIFMITSTEMSLSFNYVLQRQVWLQFYVCKQLLDFAFTSTHTSWTSSLCLQTRVTSTTISLFS